MNSSKLVFIVLGVLVAGAIGVMVWLFLLQPKTASSKHGVLGESTTSVQSEATPSPVASATPLDSPTPSPVSALSTGAAGDPATRDAQRQTDLAQYVAAYKALAVNGFYPTNPPAVSVSATDPSTGQPYTVVTTTPATPGQVQYKAGGSCTGPAHVPGTKSTHYVALYTQLESSPTPYCLDVK
jgi:hypothetical protein